MFKQGETVEYKTRYAGWCLATVVANDGGNIWIKMYGADARARPTLAPPVLLRPACLSRNGRCSFANCDAPPVIKMPRSLQRC